MMKSVRQAALFGMFLLGLGAGCGGSPAVGTDITSITGGDVSGEQLAIPDGDGPAADDHAGPCGRSDLDRLKGLLSLSDDQVTQIQAILDATRAALKDLRAKVQSGSVGPADAAAQDRALHDQQKAQIMALLTPDQQAKFTAMRDHHAGPFDLARLKDFLGLSDAQVTQIDGIMKDTQAKVNDVHAQVEAGTLTRDAAHTQIDQILKASMDAIKAVLTADQQAKLAQALPPPPGPGGPGPGAPPPPGGPGPGAPGGHM